MSNPTHFLWKWTCMAVIKQPLRWPKLARLRHGFYMKWTMNLGTCWSALILDISQRHLALCILVSRFQFFSFLCQVEQNKIGWSATVTVFTTATCRVSRPIIAPNDVKVFTVTGPIWFAYVSYHIIGCHRDLVGTHTWWLLHGIELYRNHFINKLLPFEFRIYRYRLIMHGFS